MLNAELKGKPLTLGAKVFSSVIVLAGLSAKIFWAPYLPFDDVIKAAGFIVLVFAPVDASLIARNIFQRDSGMPL